jgi:hypothetical protein
MSNLLPVSSCGGVCLYCNRKVTEGFGHFIQMLLPGSVDEDISHVFHLNCVKDAVMRSREGVLSCPHKCGFEATHIKGIPLLEYFKDKGANREPFSPDSIAPAPPVHQEQSGSHSAAVIPCSIAPAPSGHQEQSGSHSAAVIPCSIAPAPSGHQKQSGSHSAAASSYKPRSRILNFRSSTGAPTREDLMSRAHFYEDQGAQGPAASTAAHSMSSQESAVKPLPTCVGPLSRLHSLSEDERKDRVFSMQIILAADENDRDSVFRLGLLLEDKKRNLSTENLGRALIQAASITNDPHRICIEKVRLLLARGPLSVGDRGRAALAAFQYGLNPLHGTNFDVFRLILAGGQPVDDMSFIHILFEMIRNNKSELLNTVMVLDQFSGIPQSRSVLCALDEKAYDMIFQLLPAGSRIVPIFLGKVFLKTVESGRLDVLQLIFIRNRENITKDLIHSAIMIASEKKNQTIEAWLRKL